MFRVNILAVLLTASFLPATAAEKATFTDGFPTNWTPMAVATMSTA